MWNLALAAIGSSLFVRGVEQALPGIWTGVDHLINSARVVGAFFSQLFAIGGGGAAVMAAVRLAQSRRPGSVRALSVGICLMLLLSIAITSGALAVVVRGLLAERVVMKLPLESELVLGGAVVLFAIAVAWDRGTEPILRVPALVLAGAALVGIARGLVAVFQTFAGGGEPGGLTGAARVAATVEWALQALVVVLALSWIGTARSPRRVRPHSRGHLLGALAAVTAIALASFGSYLAIAGLRADPSSSAIFAARALERLLDPLPPYVPLSLRSYVELLRWSVATASLVFVPRGLVRSTVVALALIAGVDTMTPLGALALALAAWSLALCDTEVAMVGDPG